MIIRFSQTASYWMQQYDTAVEQERYVDAMGYVRKAMQTDTSFEVWFAYAELLYMMEQYDLSASVCLLYGRHRMTNEDKKEWCRLMVDNANATSNLAAMFHYNQLLLQLDDLDEDMGDMLEDLMDRLFEEFDGRPSGEDMQFSSDAHQEQNRAVYDEMLAAYERDDNVAVLALEDSLHPDYDYYTECLFMVGKARLALGQEAEGVQNLLTMYERSRHDARVLFHLCDVPDAFTAEDMRRALSLVDDSSKDNLQVAAMCAYRHGMDDLALDFALRALAAAPDDAECMLRVACAYCNVGDTAQCYEYVRRTVALYDEFFPRDLLRLPIGTRMDLTFSDVPAEWQGGLHDVVMGRLAQDGLEPLMLTDDNFRDDVRFLLTHRWADSAPQEALAARLDDWRSAEGNDFVARLLLSPNLTSGVRYRLLYRLLTGVGHGRVYIARHYILGCYTLRLPPSFADYPESLRSAYVHAYCEMVMADKHSPVKLCRVAERLYLVPPDFAYDAAMLGFAMVAEGRILDDKHTHEYILARGWDDETIQYHLDAVHAALAQP